MTEREFLDRWRGAFFYQWMCDLHGEGCSAVKGITFFLTNFYLQVYNHLQSRRINRYAFRCRLYTYKIVTIFSVVFPKSGSLRFFKSLRFFEKISVTIYTSRVSRYI